MVLKFGMFLDHLLYFLGNRITYTRCHIGEYSNILCTKKEINNVQRKVDRVTGTKSGKFDTLS